MFSQRLFIDIICFLFFAYLRVKEGTWLFHLSLIPFDQWWNTWQIQDLFSFIFKNIDHLGLSFLATVFITLLSFFTQRSLCVRLHHALCVGLFIVLWIILICLKNILVILLSRLNSTSITSFSKWKIQIVAFYTNPITVTRWKRLSFSIVVHILWIRVKVWHLDFFWFDATKVIYKLF